LLKQIVRIEDAKIVALLLTDGGITKTHFDRPRSWRLHFTAKEEFLLNEFKSNVESIFGKQQFWTASPKRASLIYLNNSDIAEYFLQFSPTYRTKQCDSKPMCPKLPLGGNKPFGPCIECRPVSFEQLNYPPVQVPPMNGELIGTFLCYYFSAEGTVTERVQLSQRHPTIVAQVQELLNRLKIESTLRCYEVKGRRYEWFLRIKKTSLHNFHDHIDFLPIKISNSNLTKKEKLRLLCQA